MRSETPYAAFGALLAERRKQAGILQQADLARILGITQQTVSRWELGQSRPRAGQVPALAKALQAGTEELLLAAGYSQTLAATPSTTTTSFDQPFPMAGLSPEAFERFCASFLQKRYREAKGKVHRVGGSGHDQDGLDIEVALPDKSRVGFQCKREQEFGPQKVHAAVGQYKGDAKEKIILLARVASPQARSAVLRHEGWDIWDKEDISRIIRELSKNDQRELVDTFFPGQRLALLGISEPGPWQTAEQFFAPFNSARSAFNHAWNLVGREAETTALSKALHDDRALVVNLVGAGGAGKSRIIKQAVSGLDNTLLRFLAPTEAITARSLEDLGTGNKILVVDDAHDRTDLQPLFQYVAVPENRAKLLLAFRPYSREYILAQAGRFAVTGDAIREVPVRALQRKNATLLARQVLEHFSGPVDAAKDIGDLTYDCPLATVMGAQVVAKEGRHLEILKNEEIFRTTLMARFQDVVTGAIGGKSEEGAIKRVLAVLALLQPFAPEDASVPSTVEAVEGIKGNQVARLVRLLHEAGVLFKRGGLYRLSPDLLADYIIEKECIGLDGGSTGYAERVLDAAPDRHHEHIVLNLGKMDWRRTRDDAGESRLLDRIWAKLEPKQQYGDPHLKAVTSVAYFQPERALRFVDELVREGQHLRELPQILKNISYNYRFLTDACALLWQLGKGDRRETNPSPEHPIRILTELCEVGSRKPPEFIEAVVDFGLSLLGADESWNGNYTPLDFLKGALATEGHETSSAGRTVTFTRFGVNRDFVAPMRKKVVDAILGLLTSGSERAAFVAAQTLSDAVRYSMTGSAREVWTAEFSNTLRAVAKVLKETPPRPLVTLEVARSVAWHARWGDGEPKRIARGIIRNLPKSIDFRATLVMADGYGMLLKRFDEDDVEEKEIVALQEAVAAEVLAQHPDPTDALTYLDNLLGPIVRNQRSPTPQPFLNVLFRKCPALADAVVVEALQGGQRSIARYAAVGLGVLLLEDRIRARTLMEALLKAPVPELRAIAARAYWFAGSAAQLNDGDLGTLRRLLSDEHPNVVGTAVNALRHLPLNDPRLKIDLLLASNIGVTAAVADDALVVFTMRGEGLREALAKDDVTGLLAKLKPLPELDGHWIEEFLAFTSKHFAKETATFFMARVKLAAEQDSWEFRPCNHGPYGNVPLRFRESPDFVRVLREVASWLGSINNASPMLRDRATELFATMFAPFDAEFLAFLAEWVEMGKAEDLKLVSHILHEMPVENRALNDFVFRESSFVIRLLERAQQFGKDCHKRVSSNLFGSAIRGLKSTTPGEPFPEDLAMKEKAEAMLKTLSRLSPAYDLYDSLRRHAEWNIQQALKSREQWEEA
jgi:transcriptional regulator with XRE-family HTH domain